MQYYVISKTVIFCNYMCKNMFSFVYLGKIIC